MDIHQASVQFVPHADRLLLRVSTRAPELFEVWLTRRLVRNLWPHLTQMVARAEVAALSPKATVLPEARAMAAETTRQQTLQQADFRTPFDEAPKPQPLGQEPMLAVQVQLTPLAASRQLRLVFTDPQRRQITLQLPQGVATAVRELMAQAIAKAEWDLAVTAAPAAPAPAEAPRLLN